MTSTTDIFPWFQDCVNNLSTAQEAQRLPHASLIVADQGCGKLAFAQQLVSRLLCKNSHRLSEQACGICKACLLLQAKTHPDFYLLDYLSDAKGKPKKSIGIDQVRELTLKLTGMSQLGGYKICFIVSVSALTKGAFNALLKTLEEPSEKTLIILLSDNLQRIPATIKSRCQILQPTLNKDILLAWLKEQSDVETSGIEESVIEQALERCFNSPLKALSYIQDKQQEVETHFYQQCDKLLLNQINPYEFSEGSDLDWQETFLLLTHYFYQVKISLLNGSGLKEYQELPEKLVFKLYDELLQFNRAQLAGSNLQPDLQLREILIKWFETGRKIHYFSKG